MIFRIEGHLLISFKQLHGASLKTVTNASAATTKLPPLLLIQLGDTATATNSTSRPFQQGFQNHLQ